MNHQLLFSIPFLASRWESDFKIFQSSTEAALLLERLKNWHERHKLKETATDAAFISLFFCDIWGYTQQGTSQEGYYCYPQFPIKRAGQTGGIGYADLALGLFGNKPHPPPNLPLERGGTKLLPPLAGKGLAVPPPFQG
jgi:hypothetical protein